MIIALASVTFLVVLLWYMERRYQNVAEETVDKPLLFLFTIQVTGFRCLDEKERFVRLMGFYNKLQDGVLEYTDVVDLEKLNQAKKEILRSYYTEQNMTEELRRLDEENSWISPQKYDYLVRSQFQDLLENATTQFFTQKILITFSNIVTVRDILQDHGRGLLQERYRSFICNKTEVQLLKDEDYNFIKETITDDDDFLNNLQMKLAHDLDDIVWLNICKNRPCRKWLNVFLCIFVSILFAALIAVLNWVSTLSQLEADFKEGPSLIVVSIASYQFRYTKTTLIVDVFRLLFPFVVQITHQILIDHMNHIYFSSYVNSKFILDVFFQFMYQFVSIYYSYKFTIMGFRPNVSSDSFAQFFYQANLYWFRTGLLLVLNLLVTYILLKISKGLMTRFKHWKLRRQRDTSEQPSPNIADEYNPIDHSVFSVHILLLFLYVGFYQNLMSVVTRLVFVAFAFINFIIIRSELLNQKNGKKYISFDHLSASI